MARVAWTMTDESTGTPVVYEFQINPNEFDPPNRRAQITATTTTAPNGITIVMQGRDQPRTGRMSGLVNTATQKNQLTSWFNKWYPIILTDDLGNDYEVIWQSVSWTRLRRAINPHRYDYTVDFMELV